MFPGRRGAGHIFHNQVALSGKVPQVCCLFGPSAAGGAYIPSFCDVVIMVEGNASMYLGSPRMAEMVVGETVSLEEMGGARMHCTVSGVGDLLGVRRRRGHRARAALLLLPPRQLALARCRRTTRRSRRTRSPARPCPERESQPFDVHDFIDGLVDDDSFFEIKPLFAPELVIGFGRMAGESVGIVANNSAVKGGVLFTDSADKAARFIWLCDAFNIPLVYLADVPGFMIGSEVERGGIIRHGAKMVSAVSSATVPQFCVVVRKAYGAGLYAMGGPGFAPDATIALPTARIAVMGPEAAVNAVYANKIAEVRGVRGRRGARRVRRGAPGRVRGGRRPRAARRRPRGRPRRRGRRAARRAAPPPALRAPGGSGTSRPSGAASRRSDRTRGCGFSHRRCRAGPPGGPSTPSDRPGSATARSAAASRRSPCAP